MDFRIVSCSSNSENAELPNHISKMTRSLSRTAARMSWASAISVQYNTMLLSELNLRTYYWLMAPLRWLLLARLRQRHQSPVTGIVLHRVADDHPNPWSITTAEFDRMLDWLQQHVDLVSIDEAQRCIAHGIRGRIVAHLSFDHGYADNCLYAIPELLRRKIPFTYFVTTHNVQFGKPFPHDLQFGNALAPNSIDEILAMADAGVKIGAQTRTHTTLDASLSKRQIEYEIRGSRDDIADWTGRQPQHFAFPFGQRDDLSPRAIQYVYDQNFRSYCSSYGGFHLPLIADGFHLKRFSGNCQFAQFRNRIAGDPRWLYRRSEFEYVPFDVERFEELQTSATS